MSPNNSFIHWGLSVLGCVWTLAMVIATIVISSHVLGKGCDVDAGCQSMLYITTTFLSSKRIETSLGFPVATERDLTDSLQTPFSDPVSATQDRGYRFGHFLECMYTARMADRTCAPSLSFKEYAVCIQNNTLIPSGLDACASFPSVGGYSHWPTSEEYISCVWNNPLLQNSESRRASQNVFRYCVEQSLWPFFEIPQSIDSSQFFGSFNWALLILTGSVVLSSFTVYTCGWKETGKVKNGEPSQLYMRLGLLWSLTAFVWNVVYFIIFTVASFRNSGEFSANGGLPTTFSTTLLTLLALGAAVIYFLSIILLPARRKFVATVKSFTSEVATIEMVPEDTPVEDNEQQRLLKSTFPSLDPFPKTDDKNQPLPTLPKYELTEEHVARFYTPPMLAIWSDSYMADFCFVLGFAGATGQLSTDVAWQLFSLTFSYRLLNMIISRCISDAFTNNIKLSDVVNDYKNRIVTRAAKWRNDGYQQLGPKNKLRDVHIGIRVIGLSTQLSALFLYFAILYIVFNENSSFADFSLFKTFILCAFAIPEGLRILFHVYYQVAYDYETMGNVPWALYNGFYAIWQLDVFARLVFVLILIFDTSGYAGSFEFLKTQTGLISRDYVRFMAV